jgi:DNA polymerase-1
MAKALHRDHLSEAEMSLAGDEFKKRHPGLRAQLKICTLGVIYGMSPSGMADALGIGRSQAEDLWQQFMGMFPELAAALNFNEDTSFIRGNATSVLGLKREMSAGERGGGRPPRWQNNHPVQAGAAIAFKMAGNRLDRLLPARGGRLIIAVHDSFVFEAPLESIGEVAQLVSDTMIQAVQELWPELRPRTEINIANPSCWNKDGEVTDW